MARFGSYSTKKSISGNDNFLVQDSSGEVYRVPSSVVKDDYTPDKFINLDDVSPNTYFSQQGKSVRVNSDADGLEFISEVSALDSVRDIPNIIGDFDGEQISLKGWHPDSDKGGGILYWDANLAKSNHNGGTIFSPTVPWTVTTADYLNGVGETDPGGTGVWVRKIEDGILDAYYFGLRTDVTQDQELRSFFAATSSDDITEAVLPNKAISFDNTNGPLSFESNCTYVGGKATFINPTVYSQRVFLTQNKTNFDIEKIRTYVNESAGGEDDYIGGGYWRFENCTSFDMSKVEVSRSFGTAIKLVLCSDFEIDRIKCKYNQFNGLEIEGCSNYKLYNYDLSYNGRYSSNDAYKPLPSGWGGTHGGRGWVVSANADTVDQENSIIRNGRCIFNSEYGARCFTASTKGIQNLQVKTIYLEDNGTPAGTYGTIVLGSDKGVDYLINSDASGESKNIYSDDVIIKRTVGYGTHISVDGEDHKIKSLRCDCESSAIHVVTPFSSFGGKSLYVEDYISNGAQYHFSFGGNSPDNTTLINHRAFNCLKFINGNSTGGFNKINNVRAVHRATTAVSGEDGFAPDGVVKWLVEDVYLDAFYQGLNVGSSATTLEFRNVKTVNTVTNGLRDFSVNQQGIIYNDCQFDSANPTGKSSQIGGGSGVRTAGVSWESSIPTAGYYYQGHVVFKVNPAAVDVTHNRWLQGWVRLVSGSAHVLNTDWREMWIHDDATTA